MVDDRSPYDVMVCKQAYKGSDTTLPIYIYTHAAYVEQAFIALCGRLPFSRSGRLISFAIYKRDKCDGAHTTVYIMPIPVYTDGAFMCEP